MTISVGAPSVCFADGAPTEGQYVSYQEHSRDRPFTAEDIHLKAFNVARFGGGYDMDQVDNFLDQVEQRLVQGHSPIADDWTIDFGTTFLRAGYATGEVDAFIAELKAAG